MSQFVSDLEIADDCWSRAEATVSTAIVTSTAFQDLVCEDTSAAAAGHVFVDDLEHPYDNEAYELIDSTVFAGFAIITSPVESPYKITRGPAVRGFDKEGRVAILIEHAWAVANRDDPDKTDRWFKRRIAQVMEDIIDYLHEQGGLRIDAIEVVEGPVGSPEEEEDTIGTNSQVTLMVDWSTVRPE
jgi:hypothetical protein